MSGPQPLLYLGTSDGLHMLRGDMARSHWRTADHALAGHDISALGWDAAGGLLVGTADGQLFRCASVGAEWEPVGAGLPGRKIWSIVADPHAPVGSFYAGLGGGHLFHSADAGATWRELPGLRALPDARYWWGPGAAPARAGHRVCDLPRGYARCLPAGHSWAAAGSP